MIKLKVYIGREAEKFMDIVSEMRINIFKEFPYLYMGNLEYEKHYMACYLEDIRATLVVVTNNDQIVGISTGIPLNSNSSIVKEVREVFQQKNINASDYYYFGEVLVMPEYRGKSLVTKMYEAQQELVSQWGYKYISILTVIRNDAHSLRPKDYHAHDNMWEHLGFFRRDIKINFTWPTIQPDGEVKDTKNSMELWIKNI